MDQITWLVSSLRENILTFEKSPTDLSSASGLGTLRFSHSEQTASINHTNCQKSNENPEKQFWMQVYSKYVQVFFKIL